MFLHFITFYYTLLYLHQENQNKSLKTFPFLPPKVLKEVYIGI